MMEVMTKDMCIINMDFASQGNLPQHYADTCGIDRHFILNNIIAMIFTEEWLNLKTNIYKRIYHTENFQTFGENSTNEVKKDYFFVYNCLKYVIANLEFKRKDRYEKGLLEEGSLLLSNL